MPLSLGLLAASQVAAGPSGLEHLPTSVFSPASPASGSIVNLAALVLAISGLIFVVVEGVLVYSIWRFRQRRSADGGPADGEPPQVYGSQPIEVAWTAAPGMIVLFLVLVTTRTLWEVNIGPPGSGIHENSAAHDVGGRSSAGQVAAILPVSLRDGVAASPREPMLRVTVVGRQWWWEYRYEAYDGRPLGFITANELHIPASDATAQRGTELLLLSADVCHSFWVPRLAGKMDIIPNYPNTLWLECDRPGLYLGQCAEYCGTQHANMLLRVVVEPPAEFEQWLAAQAAPAVEDAAVAAGRQAFLGQSCVNCHRVRGIAATGSYAPDLTHLASRQTLAAGMVENNRQNLDQWIADPQQIKPGCLMPAFKLTPRERKQIVDYLSTLR